MQLAVVDPRSGAVAARSWRAAEGLRWTAPETGIWRLEARADSRSNPRAITVVAAREADRGGSRAQPERIALAGGAAAIARDVIDWAGDDDWFAVGMSAGNSYTIYTVLGSLGATRGDVLPPGAAAPRPLKVHPNGRTLYSDVSPARDGVALIRVAGASTARGVRIHAARRTGCRAARRLGGVRRPTPRGGLARHGRRRRLGLRRRHPRRLAVAVVVDRRAALAHRCAWRLGVGRLQRLRLVDAAHSNARFRRTGALASRGAALRRRLAFGVRRGGRD